MFTSEVKIQFHDCDPAGILFYANIFKHAHDVYQEFLSQLERNYFADPVYVLPITKSSAEYFSPMKSGESYKCKIMVSKLQESSFELTFLFYDAESNVHAEVKTVHVAVNKSNFIKTSIPEDLKLLLNSSMV